MVDFCEAGREKSGINLTVNEMTSLCRRTISVECEGRTPQPFNAPALPG